MVSSQDLDEAFEKLHQELVEKCEAEGSNAFRDIGNLLEINQRKFIAYLHENGWTKADVNRWWFEDDAGAQCYGL